MSGGRRRKSSLVKFSSGSSAPLALTRLINFPLFPIICLPVPLIATFSTGERPRFKEPQTLKCPEIGWSGNSLQRAKASIRVRSACLEFLKKANEVVQKLLFQSLCGGGLLHANMSVVIKRTKKPEFAALVSFRLFVFAACRHAGF